MSKYKFKYLICFKLNMLVEVSVGEAIDKLNILEIKQTKIQDKNKLIVI